MNTAAGVLYGVGLGPGDPELVTVKFADGTERPFNPNDQVETRPA